MLPLEGTTGVASLATQAGSYLVLTRTPAQHCEPTTQGAHVVNASRTGLKMVGHAARITGAANVVNARKSGLKPLAGIAVRAGFGICLNLACPQFSLQLRSKCACITVGHVRLAFSRHGSHFLAVPPQMWEKIFPSGGNPVTPRGTSFPPGGIVHFPWPGGGGDFPSGEIPFPAGESNFPPGEITFPPRTPISCPRK